VVDSRCAGPGVAARSFLRTRARNPADAFSLRIARARARVNSDRAAIAGSFNRLVPRCVRAPVSGASLPSPSRFRWVSSRTLWAIPLAAGVGSAAERIEWLEQLESSRSASVGVMVVSRTGPPHGGPRWVRRRRPASGLRRIARRVALLGIFAESRRHVDEPMFPPRAVPDPRFAAGTCFAARCDRRGGLQSSYHRSVRGSGCRTRYKLRPTAALGAHYLCR